MGHLKWPDYRGGHISEVQIRGSSLYKVLCERDTLPTKDTLGIAVIRDNLSTEDNVLYFGVLLYNVLTILTSMERPDDMDQ